ncbi:hypothetical protein, partial [Serratia liquefaciens]|uniref:hypothetical protein n=1 Tax=Serratia liquefaciens TaxID=614 RepID=UPI001E307365
SLIMPLGAACSAPTEKQQSTSSTVSTRFKAGFLSPRFSERLAKNRKYKLQSCYISLYFIPFSY